MTKRGGPQEIPRPPVTRVVESRGWAQTPAFKDAAAARSALQLLGPPQPSLAEGHPETRRSAVLVPLYPDGRDLGVMLTRRSQSLRSHTGEVSFPGGRLDPGETTWQAALRESNEEVDLDPSVVEPVGVLDHLATFSSRAIIVPHVGLLPARPSVTAAMEEVEEILFVPLTELVDPDVYRREVWELRGADYPMHFFELHGDTVWGATAKILVQLLDVLAAGPR